MRKRQLNTLFISETVDKFVVCGGCRGGNTAQLQQMAKRDTGFDVKKWQLHKIISAKIGRVEQHLAHFCIIRIFMHAVAEAEGQVQFLQVFCCPSGGIRTFQHFDGFALVDAAARDRRWNWLGQVLRTEENRIIRKILLSCVKPTPKSIFGDVPDLNITKAILDAKIGVK